MNRSSILFLWLLCLQVFFVGNKHLIGQEKSESENNEEDSSLEEGGAENTGGQNETSTVETGTGALSPEQPGTEPIPTTTPAPVKGNFDRGGRPVGTSVAGLSQVIRRQALSIDVSSIRSVILEATPEIQLSKKIGKVDENSRAVLALNLSDEQIQRFYALTKSVQESLLKQEQSTARRLLSIEGLATKHGKTFFSYNTSTRNLILQLDNQVMLQLLDEGFDQELLSAALTKMNILASRDNNQPTKPKINELDLRALALSDRLRESGNEEVMDILYDLSGSDLTEEWIRVGEVADVLLQDYDLGKSLPSSALASTDVFGNPFFDVANALFEELKLDELINGENSSVLAGKNLIVRENAEFLNSFFSTDASDLILVSSEELWIQKDFVPQFAEGDNKRVVIMGGGSLKVTPNIQIGSALSDLLISTNAELLLRSTTMEAARELVIRGYRDVTINNSSISAQTLAMIKARRDLTIDGLAFKRDVSRIIMEATTMRLSNIDFPAASQVRLNTLKGGVDGRYPNFGRQIPAAQQIGRVNFIDNVRSGGNLMNDRHSFDLHGKNIEIGKLARP
ncbi:hypothetical protein N8133_01100 [bacterium]|nr:hypothetical protein [bacterium]